MKLTEPFLFVVAVATASPSNGQTRTVDEALDTVTLTIPPRPGHYVVTETLPTGLVGADITASGTVDSQMRKIKWGPFDGSATVTLSYRLVGQQFFPSTLFGEIIPWDNPPVPIGGDERITPQGGGYETWAARNFGDLGNLESFSTRDSDGDGFPNFAEQSLALDPTRADAPALAFDFTQGGLPRLSTRLAADASGDVFVQRFSDGQEPFTSPVNMTTSDTQSGTSGILLRTAVDTVRSERAFYRILVLERE